MPLDIATLNSGSNGNCYYVGTDKEAVLVDAGLSCRETEKRMKRLGLSMHLVKAIFISHEHADHIHGLEVLSKKYQLPVYITPNTLQNGRLVLNKAQVYAFSPHLPVAIGQLRITAFPKYHDASDPYSFVISDGHLTIGVFTDIGIICDNLIRYFKVCHAAFLESNYDVKMLLEGSYPAYLKKRITGGMGHLSNDQALELFTRHRPTFMSHLLLAHLSKNNNDPDLVRSLFTPHAKETKIIIATRYEETPVYCIDSAEFAVIDNATQALPFGRQLKLF